MDNQAYNGWTNRQTWAAHLWLSNDEPTYHEVSEIVNGSQNTYAAADTLKEWLMESNPLATNNTVYSDLLDAALNAVNYQEIAEAFWEDKAANSSDDDDNDFMADLFTLTDLDL